MSQNNVILKMEGIYKEFPGVIANNYVDISITEGEIHALVGENGAGKTTLMKIASGIYKADKGNIYVNGEKRNITSPLDAFQCGISAVHQEFMLVDSLTVLENIVLGFEPRQALGFLNYHESKRKIKELIDKYGMNVPINATVGTLPVAIRQQVEILKALYKDSKILILDEPTAVLTPQETEDLFRALKSLQKMGTTIIFVTHKLNEVLSISDRVTVMRGGAVKGTLSISEVTQEKLARLMIGRDVVFRIKKKSKEIDYSSPLLQLSRINLKNKSERPKLNDINFSIFKGEILGIAGVAGNGQSELVELIYGFQKPDSGKLLLHERDFAYLSPRIFRAKGSYVCQDRRQVGSSSPQTLWENTIIGLEDNQQFSNRLGALRFPSIYQYAKDIVEKFDVRTTSIDSPAENLSGGNLQKLILGRELARSPSLLIAEDPTRGLDVGATEYIRDQIVGFAAKGRSVLLVSQDLHELLMLSDRILIMFRGEIVGEIPAEDATPELVGLYMMGLKKDRVEDKAML